MARMNREEFFQFLNTQRDTQNRVVDFGGEGKVVVLRWSLPGSDERTEKKVLFASQAQAMVKAAHSAFTQWLTEWSEGQRKCST